MFDGGELMVTTERDEDDAVLSFIDTGTGIAEEELEKIFEPFYTTKDRGTGLGLAITKQIIEQHHGSIQMTSRLDHGTTVTIRLPISQEKF